MARMKWNDGQIPKRSKRGDQKTSLKAECPIISTDDFGWGVSDLLDPAVSTQLSGSGNRVCWVATSSPSNHQLLPDQSQPSSDISIQKYLLQPWLSTIFQPLPSHKPTIHLPINQPLSRYKPTIHLTLTNLSPITKQPITPRQPDIHLTHFHSENLLGVSFENELRKILSHSSTLPPWVARVVHQSWIDNNE